MWSKAVEETPTSSGFASARTAEYTETLGGEEPFFVVVVKSSFPVTERRFFGNYEVEH